MNKNPASTSTDARSLALSRALALRGRHVVLFDGECGLCDRLVRFVLARDPRARFAFASLQSSFAADVLSRYSKDPARLDTVYVIAHRGTERELLMSKARAVLFICKTLGGPWRAVSWLGVLPDGLLDFGYDLVARTRYRLFGRRDACALPKPEHADRFIDA